MQPGPVSNRQQHANVVWARWSSSSSSSVAWWGDTSHLSWIPHRDCLSVSFSLPLSLCVFEFVCYCVRVRVLCLHPQRCSLWSPTRLRVELICGLEIIVVACVRACSIFFFPFPSFFFVIIPVYTQSKLLLAELVKWGVTCLGQLAALEVDFYRERHLFLPSLRFFLPHFVGISRVRELFHI